MNPDITAPAAVSLRGRAKLATAGLFAITAVHVIAMGASAQLIRLIARIQADTPVEPEDIEQLVTLGEQLEVAYWVGLAAAASTFIVWFHRAYKNLAPFGATLASYHPGAAISCWFIPFVNLARPLMIAKEIWIGSSADRLGEKPGSPIISWWWAAWLVSGFAGMILLRSTEAATLDQELSLQYRAIIVNGLRVVAAVLAMLVVKRITSRQEVMILASARVVK